ncbi:MAG: hypothetical protein HUJ98_08455, partial [Bacteroidaceae bacterium]|nr:hypothetical protein [Bacteroidaceae bacterium]
EENKTNLLFKPIMTTLEVELKGMTGEDANAKSITVKSMEVTIDREADVLYSVGNDKYFDIKINSSDGSINSIDTTPTKKSERTFTFTLKEPQTVEKGGSISITAILPGIDIGGTNGKPVTITINTADGSNISTFSGQVKSGYKAKIVTEPWAKPEKYVDLGLSVKWATCNLGASKPEEYGDYYGWGCVKPYEQGENVGDALYFSKLGYAGGGTNTYGTENDPLKDYVISSIGNIAGSNWDAARAKLSDKWRMPTKTEFAELLDKTKCTWEWITNYNGTGRNGYLVTSNVPGYKGNSIFLPAAGYRTGTSFKYNNLGYYWSSNPSNSTIAHILLLGTSADLPKIDGSNRRFGFSIRPVWDSSTDEIKEVDLGLPSGTKWASRCLGPSDESSSISGSG